MVQWKEKNPWRGRPKFKPVGKHLFSGKPFTRAARVSIDFIYFRGSNKKQRSCNGGEGRAAPRLGWQWVQKDGCAQRTGAHARPNPTSLSYIYLGSSVCHPVCHPVIFLSYSCHSCRTLSYSLCLSNQTDQGDEREGFEREGYRWRDRRWRD